MRKTKKLPPVHPGEILKEEFLIPLKMSANQLATALRVPSGRVTQIINGQRSITADTAMRLARYFGSSPEFWLNLQKRYELQVAEDKFANTIFEEVQPRKRGREPS